MADKFAATFHGSELLRRRELAGMSKPELIDWVVQLETANTATQTALTALRERIGTAYGQEP